MLNLPDSWTTIQKWNTSSSHCSSYTIVLLLEVSHEQSHNNAFLRWRNVGSGLELERQIPILNMHAQVEDELEAINYWFSLDNVLLLCLFVFVSAVLFNWGMYSSETVLEQWSLIMNDSTSKYSFFKMCLFLWSKYITKWLLWKLREDSKRLYQ